MSAFHTYFVFHDTQNVYIFISKYFLGKINFSSLLMLAEQVL